MATVAASWLRHGDGSGSGAKFGPVLEGWQQWRRGVVGGGGRGCRRRQPDVVKGECVGGGGGVLTGAWWGAPSSLEFSPVNFSTRHFFPANFASRRSSPAHQLPRKWLPAIHRHFFLDSTRLEEIQHSNLLSRFWCVCPALLRAPRPHGGERPHVACAPNPNPSCSLPAPPRCHQSTRTSCVDLRLSMRAVVPDCPRDSPRVVPWAWSPRPSVVVFDFTGHRLRPSCVFYPAIISAGAAVRHCRARTCPPLPTLPPH